MADRGSFHLGNAIDAATGKAGADRVVVGSSDLTTHGVVVGMTGSGKTGLAVVLIEEALLAGIPVLVLDPKGDMANLALVFPDLQPASFRPWVSDADANAAGVSVDEYAAKQATIWREGLESSGLGPERLQALRDAADVTIYTPGSTAGVPLNVIGSLQAPKLSWDTEAEALRDEIQGTVTSLLRLVGIEADPLASREHVLLSNLVENAWRAGRDLDLGTLIAEIQSPPLRKLGVFELDQFFPPADRTKLAFTLNALVASPTFAAWGEGEALDPQKLLFTEAGKPRCAVVYLAHLSEEERQFVVTLVFSKLVTWMRGQEGTPDLRALAYMDEVFGYVPPTASPPAKKPILTIFKQGRAFGLGLVLSTQNPVDLDYKAMSNAGTWLVGRLQTENDKARVLEGLRSAAGGTDVAALDRAIGGARQAPVPARLGEGVRAAPVRDALGDVVPARPADEGAGRSPHAEGAAAADGCGDARRGSGRAPPRPARGARRRRVLGRPGRRAGDARLAPRPRRAVGVWRSAPSRARRASARSSRPASRSATTTAPRASTSSRSSRPSTARSTAGSTSRARPRSTTTIATSRAAAPAERGVRPPHGAARRVAASSADREGHPAPPRRPPPARAPAQPRAQARLAPRRDGRGVRGPLRRRCAGAGRRGGGQDPRPARGEARPAREARSRRPSGASRSSRRTRARAPRPSSSPAPARSSARSSAGAAARARWRARSAARPPGAASRPAPPERKRSAEEKADTTKDDLAELEQEILDEVAEIDEKWRATADEIDTLAIRLEATDVRVLETRIVWAPSD